MSLPPPSDNYAGEPQYPSPWTTDRPREALRDTDKARIVSLSPDVCLTPRGSAVVPIPYPIVDYCGHDRNYTPSVFFTGKKAMVLRSRTTHVHGDKPGTAKGVMSGTVEDATEPIGHASQVRAEGSNVIRHLDRFWMNSRNTTGEAVFVRDTKTYPAPKDDDPVPGSLRAEDKLVQVAFHGSSADMAGMGTSAEFAPAPPQTAPPPVQAPPQRPPAPAPPSGGPPSAPPGGEPPTRPPTPPTLGRWGTFGKAMGKVLGPLSVITSGGTPELDNAIMADQAATEALKGINPQGSQAKSLYDATHERITQHVSDAYADPFSGPDEDYISKEREYLKERIASMPMDVPLSVSKGARISEENGGCPIGPHSLMQPICARNGRQAHHVVPDRTFRLAGPDGSRIKDAPSYGEGAAVCVDSNKMGRDSEHSRIHYDYYDTQAGWEASKGSHSGLIRLSRAEDLGSEALEKGTDRRCNREYIRRYLRNYHQQGFGLEPDTLVRGQKGALTPTQSLGLGNQGGIKGR